MAQFPNVVDANGIWSLKDQRSALLSDSWPNSTQTATASLVTADVLVVGAGGGGGNGGANGTGGGGGAGEVWAMINQFLYKKTPYTIVIGSGGSGGTTASPVGSIGGSTALVSPSSSFNKISIGGAGGNQGTGAASGGGGGQRTNSYGEVGFPYIRAYKGGYASAGEGAAGGGGAGGPGQDSVGDTYGTNGGIGVDIDYTGSSVTYGHGGGGRSANNGDANSGDGGGGGSTTVGSSGGNGGSGVVVIRYSNTIPQAIVTGSPTFTDSGGYNIYKFTGSGTFLIP